MRIEVQGGTQLELPDGSTPSQIDEVINHFQSTQGKSVSGNDLGTAASAIQGFNDMVPFGNRLTAGAAALSEYPIAKLKGSGISLGDLYNTARANQAETEKQHPTANTIGEVAGFANSLPLFLSKSAASTTPVLGDAANAIQKGNTALSDWVGSGNLAARVGKGAIAGAPINALYGAGNAPDGKMLEGAEKGAATGAGVGIALPIAGEALSAVGNAATNIGRGVIAKSPEAVQDIASNLKSKGSDLYDQMRQAGANFSSKAAGSLINNIKSAVNNQNFIPELNPKTLAVVNHIDNRIDQAAQGGELSLSELDQYRRLLGKIGATEDGVSANAVRKQIDDFVNNATQSDLVSGNANAFNLLNQGRKQYQQASKFEDISDVLTKAAGDPNKIKAGLTRFLNNPDNTRGWSNTELSALKDAASTGGIEKLLKMGGKFGVDLGTSLTPGNTVAPLIGGAINPIIPIAGTVSRQAQKYAARGKAQNLLNVLENGSGNNVIKTPVNPLLSVPTSATGNAIQSQPSPQIPTINPSISQPLSSPNISPQSSNAPADLFSRVIKQESGGNQAAVSSKGAIGVAQLMPRTAPEAARAAGLPYDFNRFKNDAQYNAALGKAYLGKMMQKYGGNQAYALMAYNWGQGNVDRWIRSGSNPNQIPAETRRYVQSILNG